MFIFCTYIVLHILISGQLFPNTKIGKIGTYPLYVSSFQSLLGNQELPDEVKNVTYCIFINVNIFVLMFSTSTFLSFYLLLLFITLSDHGCHISPVQHGNIILSAYTYYVRKQ